MTITMSLAPEKVVKYLYTRVQKNIGLSACSKITGKKTQAKPGAETRIVVNTVTNKISRLLSSWKNPVDTCPRAKILQKQRESEILEFEKIEHKK
jgi:hypothetical protein